MDGLDCEFLMDDLGYERREQVACIFKMPVLAVVLHLLVNHSGAGIHKHPFI